MNAQELLEKLLEIPTYIRAEIPVIVRNVDSDLYHGYLQAYLSPDDSDLPIEEKKFEISY